MESSAVAAILHGRSGKWWAKVFLSTKKSDETPIERRKAL